MEKILVTGKPKVEAEEHKTVHSRKNRGINYLDSGSNLFYLGQAVYLHKKLPLKGVRLA